MATTTDSSSIASDDPSGVPFFSLADEDFTSKLLEVAADQDIQDQMLQQKWVLWEQLQANQKTSPADWKDLSRSICAFETVGEFWRYWRHVPQPSELFSEPAGCRFVREGSGGGLRVVESMMIFRDGVTPEWEHPLNAVGGHLQFSLSPHIGAKQIDEYWNNLVLAVVGGSLAPHDMVTGLRLCDKLFSKRGGPSHQGCVRIELWFTEASDEGKVEALCSSVEKCMITRLDGTVVDPCPKYDIKYHGGKH
ncbi:hypothetical protein FOZ62_030340 [Perkinsus olseni]|uniref:Uncharacterized protein n=4 Tax=Perkinsus olseni TaxID=32597 RepID=A0A7J6S800_PEROL|nr:hypothetical protein FOZ62_030340 [Perkinsus olseni]